MMEKLKKRIVIILFITFVILFFVLKDNLYEKIDVILNSNKLYIFLGLIVVLVGDLFKSISISNIIREQKKDYKYKRGFLLTLITNFFNGITPFSLGGQPFQLYFLKKKDKIDYVTGANVLFKDFYAYQMALVILSTICLIMCYVSNIIILSTITKRLIWLGYIINLVISLFLIYIPYSKKNGKYIVNKIINLLSELKIVKNKDEKKKEFDIYINNFKIQINKIIETKTLIIKCIILNIFKLLSFGVVAFLSFKSIGVDINLGYSLIITVLVISMASFVPIPGSSGGIEFGFITLFSYYVIDAKAAVAMLIWRFLTYYVLLLIGSVVMMVESKG